jgi:hypothetical protein
MSRNRQAKVRTGKIKLLLTEEKKTRPRAGFSVVVNTSIERLLLAAISAGPAGQSRYLK